MTVIDWLENSRDHIRTHGVKQGVRAAGRELAGGVVRRGYRSMPRGERDNILKREWDVCLVLDACRFDALALMADEYEWLDWPGSIKSTGSMSQEWLQETYTSEYHDQIESMGHISWNPFAPLELEQQNWDFLDQLVATQWDDSVGGVPPEAVTNQAIARWRETTADQMVVHYMQPHAPYRDLVDAGLVEPYSQSEVTEKAHHKRLTVWKLLRRGEITRERAWGAYLNQLRWVLDDIARLRQNLDAEKVVITADHGECFGEMGFYAHPPGVPKQEIIEVPWVEIDCEDQETVTADVSDTADEDVPNEQLAALGYS